MKKEMYYCGKSISKEENQRLYELSKKEMVVDDVYANLGFACEGLLIELMQDDTLGCRYWYCTRKTNDPERFDFLVFWDMGNSWSLTAEEVDNVTLDEFKQFVIENRKLFVKED